jgi:hypothetical protein
MGFVRSEYWKIKSLLNHIKRFPVKLTVAVRDPLCIFSNPMAITQSAIPAKQIEISSNGRNARN